MLANNQIKTLDGLRPLFGLDKLVELELSDNPVASLEGYKELLWKKYLFFK